MENQLPTHNIYRHNIHYATHTFDDSLIEISITTGIEIPSRLRIPKRFSKDLIGNEKIESNLKKLEQKLKKLDRIDNFQ